MDSNNHEPRKAGIGEESSTAYRLGQLLGYTLIGIIVLCFWLLLIMGMVKLLVWIWNL